MHTLAENDKNVVFQKRSSPESVFKSSSDESVFKISSPESVFKSSSAENVFKSCVYVGDEIRGDHGATMAAERQTAAFTNQSARHAACQYTATQ
jgi:hypothetical protein